MATQAIQQRRSRGDAACPFCADPLADLGGAFLNHVASVTACRDRYEAWMAHLDADRPGG